MPNAQRPTLNAQRPTPNAQRSTLNAKRSTIMTTLVIAEHDNASIKGATLNTVTAAAVCGGDVHVLVAGHNAGAAAAAAAQISGVSKVIHADSEALAHGLAENVAAQVLAIAANYSHILFPATAAGKNVAPRVAAKLDVAQISDVTQVVSVDTFERPIYAGNAIATVQSSDAVKVATVRATAFDPAGYLWGQPAPDSARLNKLPIGQCAPVASIAASMHTTTGARRNASWSAG